MKKAGNFRLAVDAVRDRLLPGDTLDVRKDGSVMLRIGMSDALLLPSSSPRGGKRSRFDVTWPSVRAFLLGNSCFMSVFQFANEWFRDGYRSLAALAGCGSVQEILLRSAVSGPAGERRGA